MTEVQSETGVLAGTERMRTGNVTINGKSHFGITSPTIGIPD